MIQISATTFVFNEDSSVFKISKGKSTSRLPWYVLYLLREKKKSLLKVFTVYKMKNPERLQIWNFENVV